MDNVNFLKKKKMKKNQETKKIKGLKITFDSDNMIIYNSYLIKDVDKMNIILLEALAKTQYYIYNRKIQSFIHQWLFSNRLYKLHLFRKKKSTNCLFKGQNKWYKNLFYFIFSFSIKRLFLKINRSTKSVRIKIQEKKYDEYLLNHKSNIKKAYDEMHECSMIYQLGGEELFDELFTRVLTHDLSKYSKIEYNAYRQHFFPIDKHEFEISQKKYKLAWEHHWKNNPHHWQFRQNKTSFDIYDRKQVLDVLENVLDWMAMGYQFNDRPYQYYEKNKNHIKLCEQEQKFLEHIIYDGIDRKYIQEEIENGKREPRK